MSASASTSVKTERYCAACRHFDNAPESLEAAIPGLRVMGSGYSSVRNADGLCAMHQRYLSAASYCEQYAIR
jgi:hypothetical protein